MPGKPTMSTVMYDIRHPARLLLILTLALPGLTDETRAQSGRERPPWETDLAFDPRLDPDPLRIEEIGVEINLPRNHAIRTERMNQKRTWSVRDAKQPPTWSMRIATLEVTGDRDGARDQIDGYLSNLDRKAMTYSILREDAVTIDGVDGHLALVRRIIPDQDDYIEGWLVLPRGKRNFLIISMLTLPDDVQGVFPMLEASFETIRMTSVLQHGAAQEARARHGMDFLDDLTADRLRDLVGIDRWTRIYLPTAGGEREVGYAHLTVRDAQRGALNPAVDPARYSPLEREDGLFVEMRARVIEDQDREIYIDMIARYWLRWDQDTEAWSSLATMRQRDATQTAAETGTRAAVGVGPPKLVVVKSVSQINTREPVEWVVPDGYLSQPLSVLLGELLPRDIVEERVYQFYAYHPTSEDNSPRLALRTERWTPPAAPGESWTLTTRIAGELAARTTRFDADGNFVRQERADGTITEVIDPEELRRLWRRKGLRTGGSR